MVVSQYPTPGQMKFFRSDNGTEFVNKKVRDILLHFGLQHLTSEPSISAHNAVVERFNRTIEEKTRALLVDSGFPTSFWGLALGAAEYIYNRTPHSAIHNQSPFQLWFQESPRLTDMALFGSVTYNLILNRPQSKKFDPVADMYFLVGYGDTGYLLYDPRTRKTVFSCNVKIDETRMYRDIFQENQIDLTWNIRTSEVRTPLSQTLHMDRHQQTVQADVHHIPEETQRSPLTVTPEKPPDTPETTQTQVSFRSLTLDDCSLPLTNKATPAEPETQQTETTPITYRSISLDDISLQSHLEEDADIEVSTLTQTIGSTNRPDEGVVICDIVSDPTLYRTNWEIQQDYGFRSPSPTVFPQPLQFQVSATPSTGSGNFLFPLRIPDRSNKQDLFESPDPRAPSSYTSAMKRPDKQIWVGAMEEELKSMEKLQVWDTVPRTDLPEGIKPLPWKWVFTYKNVTQPKARLVIIGSSDPEKYTISETFSPVPPPCTIRWFLSFAHKRKFNIYQIDVKTAFLHSPILQTKFATIPQGLQVDGRNFILRLKKAAYGLATSPLAWFTTISDELKNLGFQQSLREPCFFQKREHNELLMVLVYVDDILLAGASLTSILAAVSELEQKFTIKRLGFPETYVGFEINEDKETGNLFLHQTTYAKEFLKAFLPKNQRGNRRTPLNTFGNFPQGSGMDQPASPEIPYKSIVGTLYYYANATRPDLIFAVNYLSCVQSNPRQLHVKLLYQLLSYIYNTQDLGVTFASRRDDLCAYVDADFGSDFSRNTSSQTNVSASPLEESAELRNTFKSTTGCIVYMYGNPIAWICRKQPAITTSTTEAEFVAVAESSSLILFLKQLSVEVDISMEEPVKLYEDNSSTATLLRSIFHHGRLKHLALRYLKVKELVNNGSIQIRRVQTSQQLADVFTKPLPVDSFTGFLPRILGGIDRID